MAKGTLKRDLTEFTSLREAASGTPRASRGPRGMSQFKGVTIIKAGLGNHRDKNYYPAETLEAAVKARAFDGLRAYADHPDALSEEVQPERTIRDMVGVYLRPRFVREGKQGGRVVADLHLFRSSQWLSDTVDDLIELGQADKIGLSINGRGRTVERQVQLEEADPINVNWVEDFLVLRSADVVTEAGAGGGFQQLLESARGSVKARESDMRKLTEQQKRDIKAAADAGDVDKLAALMKECGCMDAAPATGGKGKAAGKVTAEADEDPEAPEGDETETEESDEETTEADVDAEAERIKAEADGDDPEDGDETTEGEDAEEGTEAEESEEDPDAEDDGDPTREAGPYKGNGMPKGAGVLIRGGKGKHMSKIKGDKDSLRSAVRPGKQTRGLQKGRRYAESAPADDVKSLKRQNDRLREENARLSTQLRVRTTTDRARNLLRESAIPGKLQPDVLRLMVGKSEDEMRRIIRYHERMVEAAVEEREDGFVEGAGSHFRESNYGGSRGQDNIADIMSEVGVPLRSK